MTACGERYPLVNVNTKLHKMESERVSDEASARLISREFQFFPSLYTIQNSSPLACRPTTVPYKRREAFIERLANLAERRITKGISINQESHHDRLKELERYLNVVRNTSKRVSQCRFSSHEGLDEAACFRIKVFCRIYISAVKLTN